MSYAYNQKRKFERFKKKCENMAILDFEKLQPHKSKQDKRIVEYIKNNNIKLKMK